MLTNKDSLQASLIPLQDASPDYDRLLDAVGNAQFVLIGESTHGTEEFYSIRAEITKKLIEEKAFSAVAIEGDWPDAYNINKYVKGNLDIVSSLDSLQGFRRFPTWMWRNPVVVDFIDWLHDYNLSLSDRLKVGFYGIDLYSLNASTEAVIKMLEKIDMEAAQRAKRRYACFDHFKEDLQSYGYATAFGISRSCEDAVIEELIDLTTNAYKFLKENGLQEDEFFYIEQNARLVKNAENYYRSMFSSRVSSWNIRDSHMAETVDSLTKHLHQTRPIPPKIVIWAHNSHIGDARATEMGEKRRELNIGQLIREKYGDKTFLIGFLTDSGTVTAASSWDAIAERKYVRPALPNSYENFFHDFGIEKFVLTIKGNESLEGLIPDTMLERTIGVIYLPQTERASHYFYADLCKQFDAVIYLDKTTAIKPLEAGAVWHKGEVYETFPSGL